MIQPTVNESHYPSTPRSAPFLAAPVLSETIESADTGGWRWSKHEVRLLHLYVYGCAFLCVDVPGYEWMGDQR